MDRGAWWTTVYGVSKKHNIYTHSHRNTTSISVGKFVKGNMTAYYNLLSIPLQGKSNCNSLTWSFGLPFFVSDGKESTCNAGDLGSIPGMGNSPGGGHGNPLQYVCQENPHGQKCLVGYSPWDCEELDATE